MDKIVGHENAVPRRMIKRKIKIGDVAREIEVHYQGSRPVSRLQGVSTITRHTIIASHAGDSHNLDFCYHTVTRRKGSVKDRHYLEGCDGVKSSVDKTKLFRIIDGGEE